MAAVLKSVLFGAAAILAIGTSAGASADEALPDPNFVGFVQQSNDFQIDSGRLALQKSASDPIRAYAKRTIAERREIAVALSRARSEARIGYVPTFRGLRPRHTAVLDRLRTLEGAEFDKSYAQAQLSAQIDTVEQVDAYAQTGGNADLRRFAADTLPRLQSELEHARRVTGQ